MNKVFFQSSLLPLNNVVIFIAQYVSELSFWAWRQAKSFHFLSSVGSRKMKFHWLCSCWHHIHHPLLLEFALFLWGYVCLLHVLPSLDSRNMRNAALNGSSGLYGRKPILKGGVIIIPYSSNHLVHQLQMIWNCFSWLRNATLPTTRTTWGNSCSTIPQIHFLIMLLHAQHMIPFTYSAYKLLVSGSMVYKFVTLQSSGTLW